MEDFILEENPASMSKNELLKYVEKMENQIVNAWKEEPEIKEVIVEKEVEGIVVPESDMASIKSLVANLVSGRNFVVPAAGDKIKVLAAIIAKY